MAVWGAPTAHEDDAERAVRAGPRAGRRRRGRSAPGLQARAGVLTGEAAVTLGAPRPGHGRRRPREHRVAAPVGRPRRATVLVGEATQQASTGSIAYEPAGEQLLKGKAAPVAAWRALRVVAERRRPRARTSASRRRSSAATPSCGCSRTCSTRRRARSASGSSRSSGQAGIGKSRLAWEFLKYVDGVVEQVWWHEGRSPVVRRGRSRSGRWARWSARGRSLLETDDAATTRARDRARSSRSTSPTRPSGGGSSRRCSRCSGSARRRPAARRSCSRAWRTFFERLAGTRRRRAGVRGPPLGGPGHARLHRPPARVEPQRPDPDRHARPPGAARDAGPTGAPASGTSSRSTSSRSTRRSMRELLAGSCPGLPEPAVRSIVARAEGIPLYAVETVRMLVADGRLAAARGGRRTSRSATSASSPCPDTLHALIAARLDALDAGRPRARPGRGGPRPELHRRRASPRVAGSTAATLEPRLRAPRPRATCSTWSSTRGRPSAASTRSSRRSSARSPTRRWPARPPDAAPRRRALLRGARRRRAGRRARRPLPRGLPGIDRGRRGGGARGPGAARAPGGRDPRRAARDRRCRP